MKEIDIQVQEAQSQTRWTQRGPHHDKLIWQRLKTKKNFKQQEKDSRYLHGSSHKTISWFLNRNISGQKELTQNIQSDEKREPTVKTTFPNKSTI